MLGGAVGGNAMTGHAAWARQWRVTEPDQARRKIPGRPQSTTSRSPGRSATATSTYLGRPRLTCDEVVWDTEEHGLPDQEIELLARHEGAAYSRFLHAPIPGTAIALSRSRSAVDHGDHSDRG